MHSLRKSRAWCALFVLTAHIYEKRYDSETVRDYSVRLRKDTINGKHNSGVKDGLGVERFGAFEQTLEHGFVWGRHHFEREFHNVATIALSELLLGTDWTTYGPDIAQDRGWDNICKLFIGTAPRRFGKSASLAKLIATLVYVILIYREGLNFTEYNVAVFSTGRRASSLLSQYVEKFLLELGLFDYFSTNNSEVIALEVGTKGTPDYMKITCMFVPSNPDT